MRQSFQAGDMFRRISGCGRARKVQSLALDMHDFAQFSQIAAEASGSDAVFHMHAVYERGEGETLALRRSEVAGDGFAGAEVALKEEVFPSQRSGLGLHVTFGRTIGCD